MNAGDSAEHDELRQVVRDLLREHSPSPEVRRLMEAGETRDDRVWTLLAGQLGLTGIAASPWSPAPGTCARSSSPWAST